MLLADFQRMWKKMVTDRWDDMNLTDEQIDREVADIHNNEKWGDLTMIHVKNIKSNPMEFGFLFKENRASVHKIVLQTRKVKEIVEYWDTREMVFDGWIVD